MDTENVQYLDIFPLKSLNMGKYAFCGGGGGRGGSAYADSEGSDQPARIRKLIWAIAVH